MSRRASSLALRVLVSSLIVSCLVNILWLGPNLSPSSFSLHHQLTESSTASRRASLSLASVAVSKEAPPRHLVRPKLKVIRDDHFVPSKDESAEENSIDLDDRFVDEEEDEKKDQEDVEEEGKGQDQEEVDVEVKQAIEDESGNEEQGEEEQSGDQEDEDSQADNAEGKAKGSESMDDGEESVDDDQEVDKEEDDTQAEEDVDDDTEIPLVKTMDLSTLEGKQRVIALLHNAGIAMSDLDAELLNQLPSWDQVKALYYRNHSGPTVYGLETCESYRRSIPVDETFYGVAGLFNTGSNALNWALSHNIVDRRTRWQVPWGKHRLAAVKWNHTAHDHMGLWNKTNVLPVVMIKDPFTWLQSMCRSPYATKWRHSSEHCPNLVPNEFDRAHYPKVVTNRTAVPVLIDFDRNSTFTWASLVDLWNDWYRQYLEVDYPRLMIRFEDLLFAPEQLLKILADCMGAEVRSPLSYQTSSSKSHGSGTDLAGAMIKFGRGETRLQNLTSEDLRFANRRLDSELMTLFDYPLAPVLPEPSNSLVQ